MKNNYCIIDGIGYKIYGKFEDIENFKIRIDKHYIGLDKLKENCFLKNESIIIIITNKIELAYSIIIDKIIYYEKSDIAKLIINEYYLLNLDGKIIKNNKYEIYNRSGK